MKYLIFLCLLYPFISAGQELQGTVGDFYSISTPLTLSLDNKEEIVAPKKKKPKKGVYYGIKTKKGFARKGVGQNVELELFSFIKEPMEPDKYVRDIYWYDYDRQQIRKTRTFDPSKGVLLHGPYTRKKGNKIIEEGIFYVGTKHGRWVKKDANDILIDKEGYYKGWPKESLVSFYDKERAKIKEIVPIEYGEKEGNYYYFFENGAIAVNGEFRLDNRFGMWSEFYSNRRGRKRREIQYAKDAFNTDFQSYIKKEWNTKGQVVYDFEKDKQ